MKKTVRSGHTCNEHLLQLHRLQLTTLSASRGQLLDMGRSVLSRFFYVVTERQEVNVVHCHFGPADGAFSLLELLERVVLFHSGPRQ